MAAKDQARQMAESACRVLAMQIKHNRGVTDDDKVALGVRPLNAGKNRVQPPATAPLLSIIIATPGVHTLACGDSASPGRKARPAGAASLQLFCAVADRPLRAADGARFYASFTRTRFGVEFKREDDGKVATYFARWATPRGDTGPWSLPSACASPPKPPRPRNPGAAESLARVVRAVSATDSPRDPAPDTRAFHPPTNLYVHLQS